jgi:hypothetical protein
VFIIGLFCLLLVGILCLLVGFWSFAIVVYNRADECYSFSSKLADCLIGSVFISAGATFIIMSLALTFN